jgi:hypothetical protein
VGADGYLRSYASKDITTAEPIDSVSVRDGTVVHGDALRPFAKGMLEPPTRHSAGSGGGSGAGGGGAGGSGTGGGGGGSGGGGGGGASQGEDAVVWANTFALLLSEQVRVRHLYPCAHIGKC